MKAEFRFPLLQPVELEDFWPIKVEGADIHFEIEGSKLSAISVTFLSQSPELAPAMNLSPERSVQARISVPGSLEQKARQIITRFRDYINLYISFDIVIEDIQARYIAESEEERALIKVHSLDIKNTRPRRKIPFSIVAQAFFAVESDFDPSFASHLAKAARDAQSNHQFIDAFRYGFLLIEAAFGKGNFKSKGLFDAFTANPELMQYANETIEGLNSDRPFSCPEAVELVNKYPSPVLLIKHLVSQRGFYFHGNMEGKLTWHPGQQKNAKGVARIAVDLACQISSSYGSAMFEDDIAKRFFENAQAEGAIMKVDVDFAFIDEDGFKRRATWEIHTTGTKMSNSRVIEIHRDFLERASVELTYCKIIFVRAFYGSERKLIFSSEYAYIVDIVNS